MAAMHMAAPAAPHLNFNSFMPNLFHSSGPESIQQYRKRRPIQYSSDHADFLEETCTPCKKIHHDNNNIDQIIRKPHNNNKNVEVLLLQPALHHIKTKIEEQLEMIRDRKLSLVLDLDHTLLHSVNFSHMETNGSWLEDLLLMSSKYSRDGLLYCIPELNHYTKLRPGVREFLSNASKMYKLHVCTMGDRNYATQMARLLDPKGDLFQGRIISRENFHQTNYATKHLSKVLGLESGAIIVDDTPQVWPLQHRGNLLQVPKYVYFPDSPASLITSGALENQTLASMLHLLENVHHSFFSKIDTEYINIDNVKSKVKLEPIVAAEKRKVLVGCKIAFSRVYPSGDPQPQLHPLWKKAEEFGAMCTSTIDGTVTHVVTTSSGTDKAKWASLNAKFCVSPQWIEASALMFCRQKEQSYPAPP